MPTTPTPSTGPVTAASSGYRCEAHATAGPSRRGRVGGGSVLLIRVRLHDDPELTDCETGQSTAQPDVYTDLDPWEARRLAGELLSAADAAERDRPDGPDPGWSR